jgi:hypothetical protein
MRLSLTHLSRVVLLHSLNHSFVVVVVVVVVVIEKGMVKLPVGLTSLNVGFTQVTGSGLQFLSRLTALRDLNLESISGMRIEHLQVPSLLLSL